MPEYMSFEVDMVNALRALQAAPKEIKTETRRALVGLAKEVVQEARSGMPSGMAKGKYGYNWSYWGSKGVVMSAQGSDSSTTPRSWAGALEGGEAGTDGFRHPVWPKKTTPRSKWAWGPKNGRQPAQPLLHKAWAEARGVVVPKMEAVVRSALVKAGLSE